MVRGKFDFSGVITALVTPFKNGEVDEKSFRRLVQFQIAKGIEGFVINGTTGESPTLHWSEVEKLFKWTREETQGKVPLILGTGSNSTEKTIETTKKAVALDADAVLVVTPYYNKPPQRGLVAHFKAVAEAAENTSVILYNVPGRTITPIEPNTVRELAQISNVIGIKEASGDLNVGRQIVSISPDFLVTSGDDGTCLELALLGGKGVISVVSHVIPDSLVQMMTRARDGNKSVQSEYRRFDELLRLTYCEANPIPVKTALYLMGIIESPEMRLPLVALGERETELMRAELKRLELI